MIQIRPVHRAKRGATLSLFLKVQEDTDGDIDGTEAVRAVSKSVANPQDDPPGDDAPDAFEFTPTWSADPKGWYLEVDDATTAGLEKGFFVTDVRIVLSNGTIPPVETLAIDMSERVTEAS